MEEESIARPPDSKEFERYQEGVRNDWGSGIHRVSDEDFSNGFADPETERGPWEDVGTIDRPSKSIWIGDPCYLFPTQRKEEYTEPVLDFFLDPINM